MTTFETLGVQRWLAQQCSSLAMKEPTEIQRQCIPAVLRGKHVIGGAVTGSGKTAAFALPILQQLAEDMYGVYALVITPSRELAYQVLDQFVALGAPVSVRTVVLIGGVPHGKQLEALQARPHIAVATPGRLKFLLEKFPEILLCLRNLRFLVLDEADRLLEGDIEADTREVVALLGESRVKRQTLLFSATTNSKLTQVSEGVLPHLGIANQSDLVVCSCGTAAVADTPSSGGAGGGEGSTREFTIAPNLAQEYLFMPTFVKLPYLVQLLRSRDPAELIIVFTNSCMRCELVRLTLQLLGFPVSSLNSLLTQQQRLNNLAMFKAGIAKVLVATDIAARGLDIPEVNLVVSYDFPKLAATYVHRVGRTARAGKSGVAISLVTEADVYLVHKVERKTKSKLRKHSSKSVTEEGVMGILDEVSTAKVQAKLNVEERFGDRVEKLKEIAEERRTETNRRIRDDGKARRSVLSSNGAAGARPKLANEPEAIEDRGSALPPKRKRAEGREPAVAKAANRAVKEKAQRADVAATTKPKK